MERILSYRTFSEFPEIPGAERGVSMVLKTPVSACMRQFRGVLRCLGAVVLVSLNHVYAEEPQEAPLHLQKNQFLDANFAASGGAAGETIIPQRGTFGPWTVDLGNIGLHVGQFETPLGFGNVIDLNGNRSGSFFQTINAIPGRTYVLRFLMSGNWTTNPSRTRNLSVRFGSQRVSFSMSRPAGWSPSNMGWQIRTAEFVASSSRVGVRFSSDNAGIPDGAVVCRVEVRAVPAVPGPLDAVPVPLPRNLDDFVRDRSKAILLGKALFWDMQVGSDGRTACASCHWHAGADVRTTNTLHPGAPGGIFGHQLPEGEALEAEALAGFRGPNQTLKSADFPFHRLQHPLLPGDHPDDKTPRNPVTYDTLEVVGSQGVIARDFVAVTEGNPVDAGQDRVDPVFRVNRLNVRQVTDRNAPTSINAIFFDRSFWDGRANHYFNGVNPFGNLDPDARVLRAGAGGSLESVSILLNNAALASQAVGPVNSSVEMSWLGRSFPEVGRKMLSLRPLALQAVHPQDSVLGSYRDSSGRGLSNSLASYAKLIRESFRPEWWSGSEKTADGFTHMEANFSLYWGLSLMLYQSTLVSDQTPFDAFAKGNKQALTAQAQEGLRIFLGPGKCINCHGGSEFAGATVSDLRGGNTEHGLIEFMPMAIGNAFYDGGFYNIGVRPTAEDIGLGAAHPRFGPLSYSRQEQQGGDPDSAVAVPPDARVTVNGAFKTPTLRNIELTGPYMHNGGMKSLEETVQFYARGADFFHANIDDLDPDMNGIPELWGNPAGVAAVVAFMKSLTDPRVSRQAAPFDHPELILPNGHSNFVKDVAALDDLVRLPETGRTGGTPFRSFEDILKSGLQLQPVGRVEHQTGKGRNPVSKKR
jgi:cytochrome c peroxidase